MGKGRRRGFTGQDGRLVLWGSLRWRAHQEGHVARLGGVAPTHQLDAECSEPEVRDSL